MLKSPLQDHVPTKAELVQDGETRNKRIGRDVDFETPVVDDVERTCILPVFSIDCEMCETKSGPALTRVSIVNEAAEVVMDELVMPDEPITNYLTQFSGMTRELLKGVTTTVLDVQTRIRSLIPANAILLGHSLENDLRAMKLVHRRVIDTSLLYPHPGGNGLKQGLKTLCRTHLDRSIQEGVGGHDSIEDARACLALYALKMKKGPRFGINTRTQVSESICRRLTRSKKTSVLIDKLELIKKHTDANVINHRNDQQAVAAMLKQCQRDVNFHYIRLFAVSDFVKSFHTEETKLLEATNSVTRREISAIPTTKNSTDIVYQTESVGSIEEATQGTLNTTEESTGKVKTEVRNGTTGEQAIVDDASESSQEMTSKWTVEVSPALREGSMCLTKEEYTEQMEEVLTQLDGRIGKLIAAMPKNAVVNVIAGPGVLPESEKANKHQLFSARNGFMFMKVISGNGEAGAREPMEEDK
ncbi:hypothetical protein SARC_02981 [Sphaeroforma arctica JP610]|uniref:Exonuclease domain-containing protein n=1 Tax=Sphaeroforma arctica JP610 TaxID=667725 RepID=A0A0L0G7E4_9EUKA|nr:hypothetical protein SARC_02981 [Sphaeroforma arctica JP610]KNC84806.1 hypothetical protein SARC_02981 [Sphaeroforma arctica JP610]|eukprot:XP_014158708.1 hypothetical protein SARC_02981 [Sphaeroforma arctica JP610]